MLEQLSAALKITITTTGAEHDFDNTHTCYMVAGLCGLDGSSMIKEEFAELPLLGH